ncbi:phage integrase family protein [Noviherbaspirillum aridicola]|uniref:Phage integrase family protein n=1 Tax=Noviherbaspirillum aridicola TaxID=2849687 RepID=A0ABQ4Q6K6_9BURK|nr:phage integrase family protein [Noviherbaspirillum aridicola]GIZ52861.1 hypothetical protein NCCP691_28750 [Noviherbaspirillum aridicola]
MENQHLPTISPERSAAQKKQAGVQGQRLHAGHFAFMRAVIQGLDTRQSWDRYLRLEGEHDDIRHVRRTIQRIRDEFASAARRHARHGIARLIQLDADRIDERAGKLPTLDEFAAERGLEEFSQAEQLDFYREVYGIAPTGAARRRRVIARQLEALRWLEELVAEPPRAQDPPRSWIHPDIAARLEQAGIDSLEALVLRINGVGYRWWAGIPGIGIGKAERIVSWLRAQESSLGMTLGPHVDQPRQQTSTSDLRQLVKGGTQVVPIEKFVAPPGLDGADGRFRAPKENCRIPATNDVQAIFAWVESKAANASTRRSYLKEGERFLLWAVLERGRALSSLEAADCVAYQAFMTDPQPSARWCGPRGREKWSPLWRPFEGPLSDAARRHAAVVLKNLFSYLVSNGYLVASPWQELALPAQQKQPRQQLSAAHWQRIERFADSLAATSANARLVFALQLIGQTGLRLSEAVAAKLDDVQRTPAGMILLTGVREGKERRVPLPPPLLSHLARYLESRGLHPDPVNPANAGAYLLGPALDVHERAPWSPQHLRQANAKAGIAVGTLRDQFKTFFTACAKAATDAPPEDRAALEAASASWLRRISAGANA